MYSLPQNGGIKFFKNDNQETVYKVYSNRYSSIDANNKRGKLKLTRIYEPFVFDKGDYEVSIKEWDHALDKKNENSKNNL